MNGKHEVRLERIEQSLRERHDKLDALVEPGAVNRTEIVWLKCGLRLRLVSVAGLGGLTARGLL